MSWRDDFKNINENIKKWSSATRNAVAGAIETIDYTQASTDPTIATADPAEVAVRTRLPFSDLIFQLIFHAFFFYKVKLFFLQQKIGKS